MQSAVYKTNNINNISNPTAKYGTGGAKITDFNNEYNHKVRYG